MNAPVFTEELKAKWLEALRSGEYKQCQSTLTDGIGFCCLGVLANISEIDSSSPHYLESEVDGDIILGGSIQTRLGMMNDDGKNFLEIADYIEANIPAATQPT